MKVSQILAQIKGDFTTAFNPKNLAEIEVESVEIDSRLVTKNSVFFALPGSQINGASFITSAIKKGASLIVAAEIPENLEKNSTVIFIKAKNPFDILVEFLQIFYPDLPQNIYAVTGTNGKTSTVEFTRQILELLGKKSASIGTLGVMCDHELEGLQDFSLTTPDIVSLYKNLTILKQNNVDEVILEASSIGLEQKRISGLQIAVGAFTNFTQDHLDYHGSMAEYFRCKNLLFSEVLDDGAAVLNSDIAEFESLKKSCVENNQRIIEYGFKARDLCLEKIEKHDLSQRVFFKLAEETFQFDLSAAGDFQAMNALCALGSVLAKNNLNKEQLEVLLQSFSKLQSAPGRMQHVATLENNAQIFIDFAHSPDALKNVLNLAKNLAKARVAVLFGCGGDRDAKKRPLMGEIASQFADLIIVSDDNPRSEDAKKIRSDILNACDMKKTVEVGGRKEAIIQAITMLEPNDILILAGKGHEKYQIIADKKSPFDEEEIVLNAIKQTS
jgi:UDP-N-acetylmuramoyl-L-alanyl-D-glutamate--2,6-diaminopimelate ligase